LANNNNGRRYSPGRSYDFQIRIKDTDYTQDLYRVQIATSVTSPYQVIILDLFIDPQDIIAESLYGKDKIKLNIRLLQQSKELAEQVDFELMVLDSKFQLPMSPVINKPNSNQKDRSSIRITTVPRIPFKTMTSICNSVYITRTVKQIIEDAISSSGVSLKYDTSGQNSEVIDQVVVFPTTVYKAISYLDKTFGLFNGIPIYFCDYTNTLHIKNLTDKMKKSQVFTVYQLSQDGDNSKIIKDSMSGKVFYTYDKIDTSYSGNSVFSVLSKNINHIVKPRDTLYSIISQDLNNICSDYGLISKNSNTNIDSNISSRLRYYIDHSGYDDNETFTNSSISKRISSLSTLSLNLERNLPILELTKVGEVVKFNPQTVEYVDLSGKYILKSSDLIFNREGEWQATGRMNLIRTNKTI